MLMILNIKKIISDTVEILALLNILTLFYTSKIKKNNNYNLV